MAPPQLAGDTPILQVAHPGEVHVLVVLGHELDIAIFHRFDGGLGEGLHGYKPLVGEQRLNDIARTVTIRQGVVNGFDLL